MVDYHDLYYGREAEQRFRNGEPPTHSKEVCKYPNSACPWHGPRFKRGPKAKSAERPTVRDWIALRSEAMAERQAEALRHRIETEGGIKRWELCLKRDCLRPKPHYRHDIFVALDPGHETTGATLVEVTSDGITRLLGDVNIEGTVTGRLSTRRQPPWQEPPVEEVHRLVGACEPWVDVEDNEPEGSNMVSRREVIKARLRELEAEQAKYARFPNDDFPEGTVIKFERVFGMSWDEYEQMMEAYKNLRGPGPEPTTTAYSYVIVKANGVWYTSGPRGGGHPRSWDGLIEWLGDQVGPMILMVPDRNIFDKSQQANEGVVRNNRDEPVVSEDKPEAI